MLCADGVLIGAELLKSLAEEVLKPGFRGLVIQGLGKQIPATDQRQILPFQLLTRPFHHSS